MVGLACVRERERRNLKKRNPENGPNCPIDPFDNTVSLLNYLKQHAIMMFIVMDTTFIYCVSRTHCTDIGSHVHDKMNSHLLQSLHTLYLEQFF